MPPPLYPHPSSYTIKKAPIKIEAFEIILF